MKYARMSARIVIREQTNPVLYIFRRTRGTTTALSRETNPIQRRLRPPSGAHVKELFPLPEPALDEDCTLDPPLARRSPPARVRWPKPARPDLAKLPHEPGTHAAESYSAAIPVHGCRCRPDARPRSARRSEPRPTEPRAIRR